MSSSSTPSRSSATKELRRRRFFEAISSKPTQGDQIKSHEQAVAQPSSNEPQPSSSIATSTSDSLDTAQVAMLTSLHNMVLAQCPKDLDAMTPAQLQETTEMYDVFKTVPPSLLPPELRGLQRKTLAMREPLERLGKTPGELLPPHLLDLKRRLLAIHPRDPNDPDVKTQNTLINWSNCYDDAERRINELLLANGERRAELSRTFRLDKSLSPPAILQVDVKECEVVRRDFLMRMDDLRRRKPRLREDIVKIVKGLAEVVNGPGGIPSWYSS